MQLKSLALLLFWSSFAQADHFDLIAEIRQKANDPAGALEQEGKIEILGNSTLDEANIVFLPEIHDDPDSLLTQLLILARERKRGGQFLVLDESLAPLKRSTWELFSQKTLEILAARDSRAKHAPYVPRTFEMDLKKIARKFQSIPGQMSYLEDPGIWSLGTFVPDATVFYGWDAVPGGQSLTARNIQMVATLKAALKRSDRIFIMLGVRHVPELEYKSSQQLLCKEDRTDKAEDFFAAINQKYGAKPELAQGIGATLPIYEFLKDKRYAIAFSSKLYGELDRVVQDIFPDDSGSYCFSAEQDNLRFTRIAKPNASH